MMELELPRRVSENIERFTGRTWVLGPVVEWLKGSDRIFILTGDPGTGKSMITAWLAGMGPIPSAPAMAAQLQDIRARVKAVHFCMASSGSTAPETFAKHMAEQLAASVNGYSAALAATLSDRVQIHGSVQAGAAEAGGQIIGVRIGQLDLAGLGDELSFDRALRGPLKQLYKGYNDTILLLVDALDEAITYTGSINIVQLLAKLVDLPERVRVIASTRPDPRVLFLLHEFPRLDLIKDAPSDADDVLLYARERLAIAGLEGAQRSLLAGRISEAAKGIFLYAHLVLDDLIRKGTFSRDPAAIPLPSGLPGIYHNSLNREFGAKREKWFHTGELVLGLIAVAQGDGLLRSQLEHISGQQIGQALEMMKQYLDGELPEGPFRPFHRSFVDFLLEDRKNNVAYHIEATRMHKAIADYYWSLRNGAGPYRKWDNYGLQHTATHLAEAVRTGTPADTHKQVQHLVGLTADPEFQAVHKTRINDPSALQRDLEQALTASATDPDPAVLPLVVESALALVAFRREELRPESLVDLARRGEIEAAKRRLDLFDVDTDWRQAALLIIALLAAEAQPEKARSMRDQVQNSLPSSGPLSVLLGRLNMKLDGATPPSIEPLPPAPPLDVARAIVTRLGGLGDDEQLMVGGLWYWLGPDQEMIGETGYFAERDGPLLVACAWEYPEEGTQLFQQYLSVHTSYAYVQYRNRSLWVLLSAVLRHPDQDWVRKSVAEIATAALAGSRLDFHEATPLVILALQARAGLPGALKALEEQHQRVRAAAAQLQPGRGQGDLWGSHNRRLGAMAQAFALLFRRVDEAAMLLDLALHLPYGFAGFQAPTCLTLAETIRVCQPTNRPAIQQALQAAMTAAHNVQDATFCARMTSRCNAMAERWWKPEGFDIEVAAARLRENRSAPEFTALHRIGEGYALRSGVGKIPLPEWLRDAKSLRMLADIYPQPLREFQGANSVWSPDDWLPPDTHINVPDPGFAPLIAARFAAELLIAPSPPQQRVELLQGLVPVAALNPTALDTVLARLLLAAEPRDPGRLEHLGKTAARYLVEGLSEDGKLLAQQITGFVP
jgi:hypothetical protein